MRPLNGANILLLLRNKSATNWEELCAGLGLNPEKPEHETLIPSLLRNLHELRQLGLVQFAVDTAAPDIVVGEIRHTQLWNQFHQALGGQRLVDLATLTPNTLVIQPYFGRPKEPVEPLDVFVVMPFLKELEPVYNDHIQKVVMTELHLRAKRGDDFFSSHEIISDVWAGINAAKVIIADITGHNANVFYEIGLAHTVGKPVVLITRNLAAVPFDVNHFRVIFYENTKQGMQYFEQKLTKTLQETLGLRDEHEKNASE